MDRQAMTKFRPRWVYAQSTALVLVCGCSVGSGGEGQPCENQGSTFHPKWVCETGLVCNTGYDGTPKGVVCETPGANSVGGTCGTDANCAAELWCNINTCEKLLGVGDACPYYTGCAAGLVCSIDETSDTPHCVLAGGLGEPCRTDSTCDLDLTCDTHPAHGLLLCVASDAGADAGP